ncbi:glycosyltransferase [Candidatus Peregrinibacteria bacterium]|nr:MAG: glycosyltransferase [Candidatus Peregrinibacteria bacterium]
MQASFDSLKVALVCDWLTVFAGAERVILEFHELFPNAPIYTTLYSAKNCPQFAKAEVRESWLRFIPGARRFHRLFLPWMPKTFETLDLDGYDLVLSSCHSTSKGIVTSPRTLHVSYCHSPIRYVWDQSHRYQKEFKSFAPFRFLFLPFLNRLRIWDRLAAERVDAYLTNSQYVAQRIQKYYGRSSKVIAPPVDLFKFSPYEGQRQDYYLAVGRLIPYKRFDLIVDACRKAGKSLKIVGTGPSLKNLKKRGSEQVEFLGKVSDEELKTIYQHAKALIFPQLEDFGIVPLEAMACGTPVLAYKKGGALETVTENVSGLFLRSKMWTAWWMPSIVLKKKNGSLKRWRKAWNLFLLLDSNRNFVIF